jgi:hypothetical protein
MELNQVMESYATRVDGKHSTYDESKSIVIVPVTAHRFQSVIASLCRHQEQGYIEVSTKICSVDDLPEKLFWLQKELTFGKLVVRDDYLQAVAYIDDKMSPGLVDTVINDIATFADQKEKMISGSDKF